MKRCYPLLLLLVYNCSNPKLKIVEQEKSIKQQLDKVNFSLDSAAVIIDTSQPTFEWVVKTARKKAILQRQYDSLEMELKKY